jgi:predicted DNA-binding transcriptional regulator AlpA
MTTPKQDAISKSLTMTIPEVADALQCSDRHLFDMRMDGRIPLPSKTGKRKGVRWSRRVIEEWIDAGCPALAV